MPTAPSDAAMPADVTIATEEPNPMRRVVSTERNTSTNDSFSSMVSTAANAGAATNRNTNTDTITKQNHSFVSVGEDFASPSGSGGGSGNLRVAIDTYGFKTSNGVSERRSIHPDTKTGTTGANGNRNTAGGHSSVPDPPSGDVRAANHKPNNNNTQKNGSTSSGHFQDQPLEPPTQFHARLVSSQEAETENNNSNGWQAGSTSEENKNDLRGGPVSVTVSDSTPFLSSSRLHLPPLSPMSKAVPLISFFKNIKSGVKRTPRKILEDPSFGVLVKDLRLSHPEDTENLNALHCFVRDTLLEVYVLDPSTEENNSNNIVRGNIVGIRCAQCGHLPKAKRGKGQSMSIFFPKTIGEIYRCVCTWQRIHFPICEHMPVSYKAEYNNRKQDPFRGKTAYWIRSACDIGIRNIDNDRSGLTYQPGSPFDLDEILRSEAARAKSSRGNGRRKAGNKKTPKPKASSSSLSNETATATAITTAPSKLLPEDDVFPGDEENDFELFGTDFDQSLKESGVA